MTGSELTGRKVFVITASAFAVIIGVNLTMAYKAISSFPGLEVKNSYVASQKFDAERQDQLQLGWTLGMEHRDGELALSLLSRDGQPVRTDSLAVSIGRPTFSGDDLEPEFAYLGGEYVAPVTLETGNWTVWVNATAQDGTPFRQRLNLYVPRSQ